MHDLLQTRQVGSYSRYLSAHSYGYELSDEPKAVLKRLDFRCGPYSRTASLLSPG